MIVFIIVYVLSTLVAFLIHIMFLRSIHGAIRLNFSFIIKTSRTWMYIPILNTIGVLCLLFDEIKSIFK